MNLTPEQWRAVQDATARLEMQRDLRELRVGIKGVRLHTDDIPKPAPVEVSYWAMEVWREKYDTSGGEQDFPFGSCT